MLDPADAGACAVERLFAGAAVCALGGDAASSGVVAATLDAGGWFFELPQPAKTKTSVAITNCAITDSFLPESFCKVCIAVSLRLKWRHTPFGVAIRVESARNMP